jgi:hypothetical protein
MSDITPDPDDELPEFAPRTRRRAHKLTFVLAGLALAAAGFYAGVLTQKHEDHGKTGSSNSALAAAFAGRRSAAGAGAGGAGAAGATTGTGGANTGRGGFGGFGGNRTTGTVKFVDGANVYITDASGNVVKVVTTDASAITKLAAGTAKDIAPGQTVTVTGTTNADGTVSATGLVVVPAGTSGGLGAGGGGAAAAGG